MALACLKFVLKPCRQLSPRAYRCERLRDGVLGQGYLSFQGWAFALKRPPGGFLAYERDNRHRVENRRVLGKGQAAKLVVRPPRGHRG